MENLKLVYRNLEMKTLSKLREKINNSTTKSKHIDDKCIKGKDDFYHELVILNDRHIFIDVNGCEYNIEYVATLEELINILYSE